MPRCRTISSPVQRGSNRRRLTGHVNAVTGRGRHTTTSAPRRRTGSRRPGRRKSAPSAAATHCSGARSAAAARRTPGLVSGPLRWCGCVLTARGDEPGDVPGELRASPAVPGAVAACPCLRQ
ncbi:hypothetical protein GRC12_40195 [Streptomyces griseorubiginosus]|nr:hypothetical protein [Streptomyces griseorubiginosus]